MHTLKVNLNGELANAHQPLIAVQNRAFRYGDGLFETMKCVNGAIALQHLHFERLFTGMNQLMFQIPGWFTTEFLTRQILQLISANNHQSVSRIRLMVFRGSGGLYDANLAEFNFLIESFPLPASAVNEDLVIGVYDKARKSQDLFSSIKSNNFLPYTVAAHHARNAGWHDAIILNTSDRVADSTISNVFIIKNNIISTPALSEGCVAGVMRRFLLGKLSAAAYQVNEAGITPEALYAADEVFLTNAVSGIRKVKTAGDRHYSFHLTTQLAQEFLNNF
jgi:branched-chain amino acid aminotransferase